jgi:FkbM family methyltransferase
MNENISLNGLRKNDFKVFKDAVSTGHDISQLNHHNFGSFIGPLDSDVGFFGRLRGMFANDLVNTVPLSTVVERAGGRVDLLQMDIQGHEFDVLREGAAVLKAHGIERLIVGTHSELIHRNCAEILQTAGYKLRTDLHETTSQPDGILIGEL